MRIAHVMAGAAEGGAELFFEGHVAGRYDRHRDIAPAQRRGHFEPDEARAQHERMTLRRCGFDERARIVAATQQPDEFRDAFGFAALARATTFPFASRMSSRTSPFGSVPSSNQIATP